MRTYKSLSGLSLIEAIIFILIIGIALSAIISVFIYTTRHGANTMLSLKTVELSQSIMDEIISKAYDDNTPIGGGCVDGYVDTQCTSGQTAQASTAAGFGADAGENRSRFDDVDDYHNLAYCGAGATEDASCTAGCNNLEDETGTDIAAQYPGYAVCIRVFFAGNEMNNLTATAGGTSAVSVNDGKRIDLIITDPLDARMTFTTYKANF